MHVLVPIRPYMNFGALFIGMLNCRPVGLSASCPVILNKIKICVLRINCKQNCTNGTIMTCDGATLLIFEHFTVLHASTAAVLSESQFCIVVFHKVKCARSLGVHGWRLC